MVFGVALVGGVFNADKGVFHLCLRFHDSDHRFNEHPFLQEHLIRNGYLQGFHILAHFVNQVYALLVESLPKVFGDIPSISVETPMKSPFGYQPPKRFAVIGNFAKKCYNTHRRTSFGEDVIT